MTESDFITEADRAEQEELVDPPAVTLASDASPPPPDVPEADALEQQLDARSGPSDAPPAPVGDREADEADVLEQESEVPDDEDGELS